MSDKNDGGPAFPLPMIVIDGVIVDASEYCTENRGVSMRDYFAAKAMTAIIIGHAIPVFDDDGRNSGHGSNSFQYMAECGPGSHEQGHQDSIACDWAWEAYGIADAMLRERAKKDKS